MLRIGTVVVGVNDVHRASEFWREALGYVPREGELESDDDNMVLVPSDGRGTALNLDTSESPVQKYPRVHLDLYPEDPDFIVLADTEGNLFCVVDKSHGSDD